MRYATARDQIRTGDLIAIRATEGILATLVRWVTGSPYTHTAIAIWVGHRLLVAEANRAGCSLRPLSHYQGGDFDVYRCPVNHGSVATVLWELLGVDIHYDFLDLARIVVNRLLGVPLPDHDDGDLICSALSATIYLHAGWTPFYLPSIPAPDDVVHAMWDSPCFEIRKD